MALRYSALGTLAVVLFAAPVSAATAPRPTGAPGGEILAEPNQGPPGTVVTIRSVEPCVLSPVKVDLSPIDAPDVFYADTTTTPAADGAWTAALIVPEANRYPVSGFLSAYCGDWPNEQGSFFYKPLVFLIASPPTPEPPPTPVNASPAFTG